MPSASIQRRKDLSFGIDREMSRTGAELGIFLGGPMTNSKDLEIIKKGRTVNFTSFRVFFVHKFWGYMRFFSNVCADKGKDYNDTSPAKPIEQ
jgi:hypothetical protein